MNFKTINTFILFLIFTASCDSPETYQIGKVKVNMSKITNPYTNSINKQGGYWTMRDSCQIHYFIDGEGEAILVIHGGPGEPYKKPWEGLRLINQNYSFIYYDQRGCGKSTRCVNKFNSDKWDVCQPELYKKLGIETAIRDIEEIRKIVGVNKITLIGHSYGCIIAALYAIEFPENIKKLLLISPAPTIKYPLGDGFDYSKTIEKELSENTRTEYQQYNKHLWDFNTIIKKTEAELSQQNRHFFDFYDEYHRAIGLSKSVSLIDNLVDKNNIGGWLPYAYAWSFPSKFDYRNNLKSIKVPTLLVWGGKDLCQESWIKQYSNYIPHTEVVIINDCGHFLFEDNPIEFSKIVNDFLNN